MFGCHAGEEPIPGYRLLAELGEGGFGKVWRATRPGGGECAVKLVELDDRTVPRAIRAATPARLREVIKTLKRLRHPNLVPIEECWVLGDDGKITLDPNAPDPPPDLERGRLFVLAMGLGQKSLAKVLADLLGSHPTGDPGVGLPGREVVERYLWGAAAGIDYLNTFDRAAGGNGIAQFVHCDIKPDNLLTSPTGVQVCDFEFGIARTSGLRGKLTVDRRSTLIGAGLSQAYAAPEQMVGEPGLGTDQFGLAISYYELRTGCLPFPDRKFFLPKLHGQLDFSLLPAAEQAALHRAADPQPGRRFASCREFLTALADAVGAKRPAAAVPVTPPPDAKPAACPPGPPAPVALALTVRFYHRMALQRSFPLRVEWAAEGPGWELEIEPAFPGCDIHPPRQTVSADGAPTAEFWVVPRVLGPVNGATVAVRRAGRPVAAVPVPIRVRRQTAAVLLTVLGLVVPFLLMGLGQLNLGADDPRSDGYPVYRTVGDRLARYVRPEWAGFGLLAAAGGAYVWSRPRRAELVWPATGKGPPPSPY